MGSSSAVELVTIFYGFKGLKVLRILMLRDFRVGLSFIEIDLPKCFIIICCHSYCCLKTLTLRLVSRKIVLISAIINNLVFESKSNFTDTLEFTEQDSNSKTRSQRRSLVSAHNYNKVV